MALSGDAAALFLHAADREVMQEATQILRETVCNAYMEVCAKCSGVYCPIHVTLNGVADHQVGLWRAAQRQPVILLHAMPTPRGRLAGITKGQQLSSRLILDDTCTACWLAVQLQ